MQKRISQEKASSTMQGNDIVKKTNRWQRQYFATDVSLNCLILQTLQDTVPQHDFSSHITSHPTIWM